MHGNYNITGNTQDDNLTVSEKAAVSVGGVSASATSNSSIGASGISQSQGQGWQIGSALGHSTQDASYINAGGTGSSHTETTTIAGHTTTDTTFTNINASGLHTGETINGERLYSADMTAAGVRVGCCGEDANLCEPCCNLVACLPSMGDCSPCFSCPDLSGVLDCLSGLGSVFDLCGDD